MRDIKKINLRLSCTYINTKFWFILYRFDCPSKSFIFLTCGSQLITCDLSLEFETKDYDSS